MQATGPWDLPAELLEEIMELLDLASARRFGGACRAARAFYALHRCGTRLGRRLARSALAHERALYAAGARTKKMWDAAAERRAARPRWAKAAAAVRGETCRFENWRGVELFCFVCAAALKPDGWGQAAEALDWAIWRASRGARFASGPRQALLMLGLLLDAEACLRGARGGPAPRDFFETETAQCVAAAARETTALMVLGSRPAQILGFKARDGLPQAANSSRAAWLRAAKSPLELVLWAIQDYDRAVRGGTLPPRTAHGFLATKRKR